MTRIMSSDFHFLVPESFHKNLAQIGTVASEKIRFEFLYVHDLGPRSSNDLDLQYSNGSGKLKNEVYTPEHPSFTRFEGV